MPQIPFCDVICGSEVKRGWVAFPPPSKISDKLMWMGEGAMRVEVGGDLHNKNTVMF